MTYCKLVPVEPTQEMIDAGCKKHTCNYGDFCLESEIEGQDVKSIYAAMLAAAPDHIADTRKMVSDQLRGGTKKIGRPQIREVFLRNGFTIKPGCDDLREYVYKAAFELLELAAPAVHGEPVAHTFYVLHDSAEGRKYIKKDISDGCLMIFEREEDARRATRQHSGTDYKRVDYYTTPQPAESEILGSYPVSGQIFFRGSSNEWVLELTGSVNGTTFTARHTQPADTRPEDVAGLPALYETAPDVEGLVVAWRWRKPVVNDQGETVGATAWKLGDAPDFLPWWANDPLIRLSDYERLQATHERLQATHDRLLKHLQHLIDQTTPLEPEPGNPMWSRRIQLDEVIAERDSLRAECEKLRKDAATEQQIQRAAQHLPEGWRLVVEVEKDAGWVDIFNPDGKRLEIDGAGTLAEQIEQAIDAAMQGDHP